MTEWRDDGAWSSSARVPVVQRSDTTVWIVLIFQTVLTGFLVFVAMTVWIVVGGVLTEPLEVIFIALVSALLTVLAFSLGLPLRLAPALRGWWFRRAGWTFLPFVMALGGIVASYFIGGAGAVHYTATANWPSSDGYAPDTTVFLCSLAVLAFASMHLLLPLSRWRHLR